MPPVPAHAPPRPARAGAGTTPAPGPERVAPGSEPLAAALDRLLARIRLLRVSAGCARLLWQMLAAGVALYAADRLLVLPLAVRAVLLAVVVLLAVREFVRRVGRPLLAGPSRLDAARLVERGQPRWEGRLVSALQLGDGPPGSLRARVLAESLSRLRETDPLAVIVTRPSLREVWRATGAMAVTLLLAGVFAPPLDVFARRWLLSDVPWPRATHLELVVPDTGPSHRRDGDGSLLVARGGVLEAVVRVRGTDPGRVELVVAGPRGERVTGMSFAGAEGWLGRLPIERGDTALFARGGDDPGDGTRWRLTVVEPPRLDDPVFLLEPPAYLLASGHAPRTVGAEGLSVPEGTRLTLSGVPAERTLSGELRLATGGDAIPLVLDESVTPPRVQASFVATVPDTLSLVLVGEHGLATPDPVQFALNVARDRPPVLRVFAPARSDLKVSRRAVVPFAVVAEDDHGVVSVAIEPVAADGGRLPELPGALPLTEDAPRPGHFRRVLDLAATPWQGASPGYRLVARDGRDLPGAGPQAAVAEGRRLELLDDAELLRLLADRQLRLKESLRTARTRQLAVREDVATLAAAPPPAEHGELVAAVVAQHQVTTRLSREAQELCAVAEEFVWNRLDAGPGAAAVLERRLSAWSERAVDAGFAAAPWRELAEDHAAGRFGRLDRIGRLLDMIALVLRAEQDDSPAAWAALGVARRAPSAAVLQQALAAQDRVLGCLDELLGRMDEWEDFQEVLVLVQSLIEEQRALRARTQSILSGERSTN